jgi:hypothetical protein
MRTITATLTVGLALIAAVSATASQQSARPSQAQASVAANRLADRAAEGVRAFRIFDVEGVSVSCGAPFGFGPRSMTCAYALHVRNIEDGTRQTCLNPVYVYKAAKDGHVYARYGTQHCF